MSDPRDTNTQILSEELWDEYIHFRRTCVACGKNWWGLHCPHDGIQNPCPNCKAVPVTSYILGNIEQCDCEFVLPIDEAKTLLAQQAEAVASSKEKYALEQRLVELDLLEQAINAGYDIHKFKLQRLEDLTKRLGNHNV